METAHRIEIVVVEETDEVGMMDGVNYIRIPVLNKGIPYARNIAASNAAGRILVFIDDDCEISSGWLDRLLAPFEDVSVAGVQGGVTVPESTGAIGWAETLLGFPGGGVKRMILSNGAAETIEISTLNCAYRTSVYKEIGGFEEALALGAEDYLFAKQACRFGTCLYQPDATVMHEARGGLTAIFKWFVRRGQAEVSLIRLKKQRHVTIRSALKSSVFVKALVAIAVCVLIFERMLIGLTLVAAGYALVVWTKSFKIWRHSRAPLSALAVLPCVKAVMDVGMDVGRIKRALHG